MGSGPLYFIIITHGWLEGQNGALKMEMRCSIVTNVVLQHFSDMKMLGRERSQK